MTEGSGSISLTNGSGSRRPKNIWILRVRIRNTAGKVLAVFQIRWIRKYLASWIWIRTLVLNCQLLQKSLQEAQNENSGDRLKRNRDRIQPEARTADGTGYLLSPKRFYLDHWRSTHNYTQVSTGNSKLRISRPGCNIQILTFIQRFKEGLDQKFNILQNFNDIPVPILQHIFKNGHKNAQVPYYPDPDL